MRRCLRFVAAAVALLPAAATAQSVSLSPSVVQLRGEAGQSTTQRLTLRNGTSTELAFALEAQDVVVREGKRTFVRAGDSGGSIAATAVFSRESVTVPPGESRSVDVMLTIPPGATTRAVVALFRGTTKLATGTLSSTASLGTLLTFTMSDRISLAGPELAVRTQTETTNAELAQTFTNDGTEPVVAKGMAVVLDSRGAIAGRVAFEPQRLLPGETTAFRAEYPGELRPGSYRAVATFDAEGHAVHRTAELVVR